MGVKKIKRKNVQEKLSVIYDKKRVEKKMSDYIACRLAQVFIVVVFVMGMISFVQEFVL